MDEKTLAALRHAYKDFYFKHSAAVEIPSRIGEREFGYIPFGGSMIRHLSFKEGGELLATLVKEGPSSAYYSCAYYHDPTAPMVEKGWKCADLIFDIDADDLNLPCKDGHDRWTCKQCGFTSIGGKPEKCSKCKSTRISVLNWVCDNCLQGARDEATKLLDILKGDFSLADSEISIYFSGSMGYHFSIQSHNLEGLDQAARSEIAGYVAGIGLVPESIGVFKGASFEDLMRGLPYSNEPGWRGRLMHVLELENMNQEYTRDVRAAVVSTVEKLRYRGFKRRLETLARNVSSRIDPGVSTDVHRIFRMPGTLHGETGLMKKRVRRLEDFDPLIEAVALSEEPMEIEVSNAPKIRLNGEFFGPYRSERVNLPTIAAVFFIGKGLAKIPDG